MTGFTTDDLCRVLEVPFTAEQLAAITAAAAPTVVVAGAGSGKTSVMTARVVWLVATGAVRAEAVLGLTFTNKAAGELAGRVRRALQRLGAAGEAADDLGPTISTYHAYAGRLVREHGVRLGMEPGARLVADAVRYQLAERVVRRAVGPFTALQGSVSSLAERVVALDGELNEHLVEPEAVVAHDRALVEEIDHVAAVTRVTNGVATTRETAVARSELLDLVTAYRAAKRDRELTDFGDQMAGAARLAEQVPDVAVAERSRFGVVLLDEYQDTSITQKRLLLALFGDGHPVTAVGDPFQAIYGWRGASVRNIATFAEEFAADGRPAARFTLARNNRSGERVLDAANAVAQPLRDLHPEVPVLLPRPESVGGGEVVVGLYLSRADEVAAVVADITEQLAAGTPAREIAVLARASSTFPAYVAALTEADVPVEVVGLGGLLALPEIVDLVSVLEVLDDPTANPSAVRMLAGPRWRIGPRDLVLLGRRARSLVSDHDAAATDTAADPLESALLDAVAGVDPTEVVSLTDALDDLGGAPYSPEARERFGRLASELAQLRSHRGDPLLDLVHRVLHVTGLGVEVSASPHARRARRRETLDSFLDQAAAFAALDGTATVSSFLAYLRAAQEYERGLDSTAPTSADSVKLLTVHKAKGLEWDVVYVPDLAPKVFPGDRGRSLWTRQPQVLPFELRGDAADFPTVSSWRGNRGLDAFADQMRAHDAAEEQRLGYVAFTRARRRLMATAHWWGPTQKRKRGAGAFLEAARTTCEPAGGVLHWEPEPEEDVNPAVADRAGHVWPAPPDPVAERSRRDAAALVRDAMVARTASAPPPVTDGHWAGVVAGWDADLEVLVAEARERFTVDRTVVVPQALSASHVVRLARDPAGLARDLARPMPRPPAPAARRGTRFHAWVEERFGQTALLDLDDLAGAGDPEVLDADLATLQQAFLAGPYADRAPVAVEAPFQLVLGSHTVRGRIDAVYATADGGFEVVDWKTGTTPADPVQLAVYRQAWADLAGVDVEQVGAAFYYVAQGVVERPEALPGREALTGLLSA